MTVAPTTSHVTARTIHVYYDSARLLEDLIDISLLSIESSTEYAIGESASIATAPLDARTEARQRLAMLRELATHRIRLLPSNEETAEEVAERSSEHEGLFELQRRTQAWSSKD